jgi:putative membrane protein
MEQREGTWGIARGAIMNTDDQRSNAAAMPAERDASTELSARRTGMSFQRTRLSADRTLMSVMRTSLSLIGFGFTIYQVFEKMHDAQLLKSSSAPRHFGEALVYLGIGMLVLGIGYHVAFMLELRRTREALKREGLIHAESRFPPSLTLIAAVLLLAVGILAVFSISFGVGPFG